MGRIRHKVESKPILVLPCATFKAMVIPGLIVDFECLDRAKFASDGEFASHLTEGGIDEFHCVGDVGEVTCVGEDAEILSGFSIP